IAKALKPVYTAPTEEAALERFVARGVRGARHGRHEGEPFRTRMFMYGSFAFRAGHDRGLPAGSSC
ncbi:hypothetical protein ACWDAZ_17415, partial [Streptomyces sp. NPDC001215]